MANELQKLKSARKLSSSPIQIPLELDVPHEAILDCPSLLSLLLNFSLSSQEIPERKRQQWPWELPERLSSSGEDHQLCDQAQQQAPNENSQHPKARPDPGQEDPGDKRQENNPAAEPRQRWSSTPGEIQKVERFKLLKISLDLLVIFTVLCLKHGKRNY